jgi:uncharacterized protein (DUF362 family)
MSVDDQGMRVNRRRFLQATTGAAAGLALLDQVDAAAAYRVGVGSSDDPYVATTRAIGASNQWPSMAGKTVIIKPNLVNAAAPNTGATTDPQAVRAVVDKALAAGAARIRIVEYANGTNKWTSCGYDIFANYDSRVSIADLGGLPLTFVSVPRGMAYLSVYLPSMLVASDVVFISVAKLKTHVNAVATLATKNLFGLPPIEPYQNSSVRGRFAMHDRGVAHATVDLNIARPVHYAVVDGVVGMEGDGPLAGTPKRMNLAFAGLNAIAVDRVCLLAMDVPQERVQHLDYAARKRMGPANLSEIEIAGDGFTPSRFKPATAQPLIEYPQQNPYTIVPSKGATTTITYGLDAPCSVRVEITRNEDRRPAVQVVRTLHNWTNKQAGTHQLVWDGRDNNGNILPVGTYVVRVGARFSANAGIAYTTGRVWITG